MMDSGSKRLTICGAQMTATSVSATRCYYAAENGTLAQLLDLEARRQIETGRTDDHREAARAFVEKRPPIFTGR